MSKRRGAGSSHGEKSGSAKKKEEKKRTDHSTTASPPPAKQPLSANATQASTSCDKKVVPRGYMLPLAKINAQITCSICKGYLIDATTVTECLHTFCKSCLLNHFEENNNNCPKCDQLIHQSHPSHYVSFDRTLQDIVYKLVPGLLKSEESQRAEYRASRKKTTKEPAVEDEDTKKKKEEDECEPTNRCYPVLPPSFSHHRQDEQLVIRLIPERGLPAIPRPIIRTSHQTTVNALKRYIALVLWKDKAKYNSLDIYCNGDLMGRDYSMRFIRVTRWMHHRPSTPLVLTYRKHIEDRAPTTT